MKFRTPHTHVIIFFVVLVAAFMRFVVPVGQFETEKIKYVYNGKEKTKTVVKPGSFEFVKNEAGEPQPMPIKIFEPYGKVGVLNYAFEGLVSGDKWGSAIGIIVFILVVGGAFGIILRTGAVEVGILSIIGRTRGRESFLLPLLFFLFSLGGAVFGMGEEAIPFAMVLVPVVVAMGYDAITGVLVTYVATQIGFATSWMNPFSVAIAQGISGVPVLSGAGFRITMWAVFTLIGIVFTWFYAKKVKKAPESSLSYESDAFFRDDLEEKKSIKESFGFGHFLVLFTIFAGMAWVVWGVMVKEYYIPSIAGQFFTIGLIAGLVGVVFKLNGMKVNDIASSFESGAKDLVGAALVVGTAKGIVLVLGGDNPAEPNVLNTILHYMAMTFGDLPQVMSAWIMYGFQSVMNFFVVSGSGQAALTMPIMAPLASLIGVTRQVAVLAFQLGDGFTNIIVPTSGCLMGVLGVARIEWGKWFKFQIKFQVMLFVLSLVFIAIAVGMGYS